MIRVSIVAPTPALRAGLQAMLEPTRLDIVSQRTVLEECAPDAPDGIILADDTLLSGIEESDLDISSLALVVMTDSSQIIPLIRALPLRGWGMLPTHSTPDELEAAMIAATQGLIVLSHDLANHVLELPIATSPADNDDPNAEPLTPREQQILALLSQGLANKQIARTLTISEHTVKFHISSLYAKLGASNRTEAISRGARRGLISF
ncbi:MAG: response regulator transcription factor [Chloroflexaceae bacterium]|nr:response regulator transcription factor [Chloroflexaceae bacterium]